MPPRAPAQEGTASSVADDDATTPVESTKPLAEKGIPNDGGIFRTTFHWELNFYSFSFLGLLYYLTPETHRIFWNVIFALIALDAARYYYAKGSTPGVPYTLPMVSLVAMLVHPVRFWAEMGYIAMKSPDGMCANTMGGRFMVFATDPNLVREIFTGEGKFQMYAHPNALWLFGPKNLIYLPKESHKAFRAILTPALFSNHALEMYAEAQERVVRQYMRKYAKQCQETGQPIDARIAFRSMAAASSQESFLGPYLTDELSEHLEEDILTFTMGFLSFPFPYLGSGLNRAIEAKERIEKTIQDVVPKAREYVKAGNKPRCLMEHWSVAILAAAKEQGVEPQQVPCCKDDDMARTVLDFLFAAQDATNSALTYSLDVLDAHRDVLERMNQEVEQECGGKEIWTKIRDTNSLKYVGRVSNELLHHKPPVPMAPQLVKTPCTLGGHALSKGAIVIPSITYSARASGASLEFLPERSDTDNLFVKTVTFGAGQHKCPGRRYAESLLTVFLAVLAHDYDFERTGPRPTMDEFVYYPTLFPNDCNFMLFERQ